MPHVGSALAHFVELQGQTTTIALPVLFIHHYLLTVPRCVYFHPLPVQEGFCGANKGSYFWKRVKESGKYKVINTLLMLLQ